MFIVDGKEQSERRRLKFHADLEHEGDVSPAQIINAGCVLVERQVAKDLDLSAIFRMDREQILKALEEIAA